jgi:hypothetical protein
VSSKAVLYDFKTMDAVAANVAQTSKETVVGQMDKLSFHCTFTAPASGTFTVQAKNGEKDSWYNLDFGTSLIISFETEAIFNLFELPFKSVRIQWGGDAACAGTLTAVLASKAVGT